MWHHLSSCSRAIRVSGAGEVALMCMSIRRTSCLILMLVLLLVTPAVARGEELKPVPRPAEEQGPDWFRDLADAAERGAIDPELVKRLEGGEPVIAFAILDGTDVVEAYGDGGRRGVAAARRWSKSCAPASRTRSTSRSCAPTESSPCCSCSCVTRSRRSRS